MYKITWTNKGATWTKQYYASYQVEQFVQMLKANGITDVKINKGKLCLTTKRKNKTIS